MEPEVSLQIGKKGLQAVIEEAGAQLEKKKLIKVKVNKNIVKGRQREFTKKLAEELAKRLNARIVWVKGRTFVLRGD